MATMRQSVFIERAADDVWNLLRDPASVTTWFPQMTDVNIDGTERRITLASGLTLIETIVSNRDDLRRFQYRLTGPLPIESHLGTIDVIADGDSRCVVVYSTDVIPHALAFVLDGAVSDALVNLKNLMEKS
ncbi:MAG: SRPBCC family protein [Acidimicrobiia bacterium]|nr:SRPBCC family protein [Acidimicrobiia bacterium]